MYVFAPRVSIILTHFVQSPFVALVNSYTEPGQQYYLKFLRPGRTDEVAILSYLARFASPDNHAIRPNASRACDLGTLLLLPDAGVPIPDFKDGHTHLVSLAGQFLRAIGFLHEHKVAHCDLKPSNVVVDRNTGYLPLIDSDLAVRGLEWLDSFSGTKGWTAPEVGVAARYNAMPADVWAAGQVLRSFTWGFPSSGSPDRQFLLGLGKKMMAVDPDARPSMRDVVGMFERYIQSREGSDLPSAGATDSALHL